jgi:hypothetical protein
MNHPVVQGATHVDLDVSEDLNTGSRPLQQLKHSRAMPFKELHTPQDSTELPCLVVFSLRKDTIAQRTTAFCTDSGIRDLAYKNSHGGR